MGLFDGKVVTLDAMIIIHLVDLRLLNSFFSWASGETAVTAAVLREAEYHKERPIDLSESVKKGIIIKESMSDTKEIGLFQKYFQEGASGTEMHEGEASCLAVAIVNNYGLASDEKAVREEFARVLPNNLCLTSRMIIERAGDRDYLGKQQVREYVRGLLYL